MKLSSFIARRYFFAKSSSNAVNIITSISVLGILVGTAALIVVLSAFNGLEGLVRSFYNAFDPDIKITPASGKFFDPQRTDELVLHDENIAGYSYVLEEKALLTFRDREYIATLKGVDANYIQINEVDSFVYRGNYHLHDELEITPAVMGSGVAYFLGFGESAFGLPVQIFLPTEPAGGLDMANSFTTQNVFPLGIFSIQPEFDEKYMLVPISFLQKLLNQQNRVSALEIDVHHESAVPDFQESLKQKLGPEFRVQNRDEQQAVFFKVMKTEGLFTFLVFALILSIATFTIAGSLTMLMFEKRKNLATLNAMGMTIQELRSIFFKEGMVISLSGGLAGLLLGVAIVLAQDYFSLITVGEGYIVDAYPVKLKLSNIFLVSATVLGLSAAVSWFTSRRLGAALLRA